MSGSLNPALVPVIGNRFRLQWEPAQEAYVLLYPEGLVKLNGSAGEIMRRCDGVRTLAEVVTDLENAYGATDLSKDVAAFVAMAVEKQWLILRP